MTNKKIGSYPKTAIILSILIFISLNSVQAQHSSQPIAEPMVFDLVRPLSSKKGELEVNTLARKSLTGNHKEVQWAPEIEYAVTDNLSVEFELPVSDLNVESYKFAVQGKVGTARKGKFIHGWQYIGEYGKEDKYLEQTALYLAGYRFNRRWSVFNMEGVRRSKLNERKINEVITNNSVFYDINSQVTLGLESNLAFNKRAGTYSLLMPQVHIQLAKKLRLQTGFGAERGNRNDFRPTAAIRLIREF
jgi:hypothetical protein